MGYIQQTTLTGYSGSLVINHQTYPYRLYDAWGDVQKAIIDGTFRVADFTVTATGTSPVTPSILSGESFLITTEDVEYAGDNIQLLGSQFKFAASKPCYFGVKLTISDATQSDLLVGLCGVDTTLTAASTAHAIAVSAGGAFFSKLDGSTAINFKTYTTGTEANTAAVHTATTDAVILEFYHDGSKLYAYVNGTLKATFSTSITTEVLTPSICFRAGEAGAKTCTVHWMRAIQILA